MKNLEILKYIVLENVQNVKDLAAASYGGLSVPQRIARRKAILAMWERSEIEPQVLMTEFDTYGLWTETLPLDNSEMRMTVTGKKPIYKKPLPEKPLTQEEIAAKQAEEAAYNARTQETMRGIEQLARAPQAIAQTRQAVYDIAGKTTPEKKREHEMYMARMNATTPQPAVAPPQQQQTNTPPVTPPQQQQTNTPPVTPPQQQQTNTPPATS